jgi:molybdate transport system substrate-binding protein
MRVFKVAFASACLLLAAQASACAATVTVMISGGFSAAYLSLVSAYEKASGNTLVTVRGPSMGVDPTAIPLRLQRGEKADVVIMVRSALDKLVDSGAVGAGVTDLATGRVALAVKAGAPRPDIGTVDAFKQTLLNAKSFCYPDSASGVYMETVLLKRLGIEAQMKPKSRMIQATPVGIYVARGECEIGTQQFSELKPIAGIDIAGLLPEDIQQVTPYTAGIVAKAPNPGGARDLIRFLSSPAAYDAIHASGMNPAAEK